jgi:hypothetical protein
MPHIKREGFAALLEESIADEAVDEYSDLHIRFSRDQP